MELTAQLAIIIELGQISSLVIIGISILAIFTSLVMKGMTYHDTGWIANIGVHGLIDFTGFYVLFFCLEIICKNLGVI